MPPLLPLLVWGVFGGGVDRDPGGDGTVPRTAAERSGWEDATTHQEILDFLEAVEARSDRMRVGDLGSTPEGRLNPVVFLGDPPPTHPGATEEGRPTVLILASMHGDERSGAEGTLQLVRDLALGDRTSILRDVNVVVVPNMNPDGGEANQRKNARGYDLNRDWIVAETPEVAAVLETLVVPFRPDVFVDVHNGGAYPYHLTYQTTLDPAADPDLVDLARGPIYDHVRGHLQRKGMRMYWYSAPDYDREANTWFWRTTEPWPRKQHSYGGLRDMLTLLYEVPTLHSPEVGADAVREGLTALLSFVAENGATVREVVADARRRTLEAPPGEVFLELEPVTREGLRSFLVARDEAGRMSEPQQVVGRDRTLYEPVRARPAPWGYALAPGAHEAAHLLRRHGFEVEMLDEAVRLEAESYRIERLGRAEVHYQNRHMTRIEVEAVVAAPTELPAGAYLVRVRQPGGKLIPQLLEPDAVDSFARWNLLDGFLFPSDADVGAVPIYRVMRPPAALLGSLPR